MSVLKSVPSFEKSQFDALDEKILIGIDPGVNTGFAAYSRESRKLVHVATYGVLKAQDEVLAYWEKDKSLCLLIEDARKRKWFGDNAGAKRMGAGSVKRDCKLWEEFCNKNGIPFRLVHPKKGGTKNKPAEFQILTGWTGRTSSHARDAAMIVYGRGRY
ncbi:hypothetical protein EHQ12_04185 [Leptospira gomenensis]|uniref:Holliday junction resolvase RuvC n=1 Tax=Leptospira gomenensis TaxID=2484974 RepID=A0A5F1YJ36_9LEPT|nr:hypothetical protein [Leptospira gomenensis]TGK36185.1 hypothetical protein EHQ17_04530 [Leptospira gomenensis]TGK42775.1 hypothetical protein EHQ07_13960 [Leptospira gomenensis]TGK42964.1 hypothetical protein EHQ12_04185 [Leptospira gomenensis]TGK54975.1 hypothetical protein EHQ13_18440 [Leptospira gomenensis]